MSIIKSKILYNTLSFYIVNNGGVRLQDLQSDIAGIKAKQLAFRQIRINNTLKETSKQSFEGLENSFSKKSQEEFNQYIDILPKEESCKYMTGISEIINLCNNNFQCKFKGEIYKSFTQNPKKECLRERIIKFEKMLEH